MTISGSIGTLGFSCIIFSLIVVVLGNNGAVGNLSCAFSFFLSCLSCPYYILVYFARQAGRCPIGVAAFK